MNLILKYIYYIGKDNTKIKCEVYTYFDGGPCHYKTAG